MHRWQMAGAGVQVGRLATVTSVGVLILALEGLGRFLVVPVWSVGMVRLGRVAVGTAVVAYAVGLVGRGQRREAVIGLVACYVLVALSRRIFAETLRTMRRRGRCLDPVLVVGNDAEAASIATRLAGAPGVRVPRLRADGRGAAGGGARRRCPAARTPVGDATRGAPGGSDRHGDIRRRPVAGGAQPSRA